MEKLFRPDNPVIRFLTLVCDLIILNVLLTIACATIVLSGTAVTSLYAVTLRMVRGEEGEITKSFLSGIRDNFIPSVPATILLFVDTALIAFLHHVLYADVMLISPYLFILLCMAAVLLTSWLSWLFPLLARYNNTFCIQAANAAKLAIGCLPVTFLLTIVTLLPFILLMFYPNAAAGLIVFWMLLGTAAGACLNSFYLRKVFDRKETPDCYERTSHI